MRHRYAWMVYVAGAAALACGGKTAAAGGCRWLGQADFAVGHGLRITGADTLAGGEIVSEGTAAGTGTRLAECADGTAVFEGDYLVPRQQGLVPLLVGNVPSGFGIEAWLTYADEPRHDFPHRYPRHVARRRDDSVLETSRLQVGYRIRRMSGPMVFGKVTREQVAAQWSYDGTGARIRPFLFVTIGGMEIVRPACSIRAASLHQTVSLGSHVVADFDTADEATRWVPFRLDVEACGGGGHATLTFGTIADAEPRRPGLFTIAAPEQNVGLELADARKVTLVPGVGYSTAALGTGEGYAFQARLRRAGGPVQPGAAFARAIIVTVEFR